MGKHGPLSAPDFRQSSGHGWGDDFAAHGRERLRLPVPWKSRAGWPGRFTGDSIASLSGAFAGYLAVSSTEPAARGTDKGKRNPAAHRTPTAGPQPGTGSKGSARNRGQGAGP